MTGGDSKNNGKKRTRRHIRVTSLILSAWNVCTLMDHDGADRPEWGTALIARELDRYKVQIAALSETWLAEEGHLSNIGTGYTFCWIGCGRHECCRAGVRFTVNSTWSTDYLAFPRLSMTAWWEFDCHSQGSGLPYLSVPTPQP